jgi:hypothetical protein
VFYGFRRHGTERGDMRLCIKNNMFFHDVGTFVTGRGFNAFRALTSSGGICENERSGD